MKDPTLDELIERFKGWEGPEVSGEVVYKMNTTDKLAKALRNLLRYSDGLICYASSMGEHEPNQLVHEAHEALAAYDAQQVATPEARKQPSVRRCSSCWAVSGDRCCTNCPKRETQ